MLCTCFSLLNGYAEKLGLRFDYISRSLFNGRVYAGKKGLCTNKPVSPRPPQVHHPSQSRWSIALQAQLRTLIKPFLQVCSDQHFKLA